MYYVYSLKNIKTNELYYGYTHDIHRRINQHSLKHKCRLVYYEAYLSESDARKRERKLKHYGQSKTRLKQRMKDSLNM